MENERRRFPRNACRLPVRLYPKYEPRVIETLTKDLSLGGLRCLSYQDRPLGMPLSVELILEPGERPVTIRGHVAWSHKLQQSDQFDLGVSFHVFPETDRKLLSTYLDRIESLSEVPAV